MRFGQVAFGPRHPVCKSHFLNKFADETSPLSRLFVNDPDIAAVSERKPGEEEDGFFFTTM